MIVLVDAQTLTTMFGGIGIGVAAIYYIITLRNNNVNRQAQLFMSIYKDYTSEWILNNYVEVLRYEFSDYQDFKKKYYGNREAMVKIYSILDWFDGMGELVKKRLIDDSLVVDVLGGSVLYQWYKWRDVVEGMVVDGSNNPSFWSGLRYLADRMERLMSKSDPGWSPWTKKD